MDLLTNQGWKMYYSCMCGGSPKEYWSNPNYKDYEIRIRPRRSTFSILHKNLIICGPEWLYKLELKLKEYEIYQ